MSFFEIFQPGLQHLREERDRRRMLVVKPTHGGGGPLGIDLEGGTARISIPGPRPAAAEPETPLDSGTQPDSEPDRPDPAG